MEEREKKAGEKYLRARFFSVWIQRSRHFAGCWIWHSFQKMSAPFQVTAVSWGSKDGRKCCWRNPNPSWRCLCPVPNTTPKGRRDPCLYLSHFLPAQPRGGISSHFESLEDEFVHILKMKSSEVLWYQPRGLMQKAESIWRAGRKYIYGNISLAGGCYFSPFFDVWPQ